MKSIQTKIISAAVSLLALPIVAADAQVSGSSANNAGATTTGASTGQTAGGTNVNAGSGAGQAAAAAPAALKTPGFYITGGRVYRIEDGRATPVTNPQTMRIGPGGIVGFDGRPMQIPKGQMLSADGRLVPLPSNVSGLPNTGTGASTGTTPAPTENVSGTTSLAEAAANPTPAAGKAPATPPVVEQVKPALPDEGTTGEAKKP